MSVGETVAKLEDEIEMLRERAVIAERDCQLWRRYAHRLASRVRARDPQGVNEAMREALASEEG